MATGVVKFIDKNKWGFVTLNIDGTKYATGKKEAPPGVSVGSTVEFEFYLKDDKWKTLSSIKATGSAPAPSGARNFAGRAPAAPGREDYWNDKARADAAREPRIAYQGAYERAIQQFQALNALGAYPGLEKVKAADKLGAYRALIEAEADHIMQLAWNAKAPGAPKAAPAAEEAPAAEDSENWGE